MSPTRRYRALSIRLCVGVTLLTGLLAGITRLLASAAARDVLDLDFPGVPATPGSAASIFVSNVSLVAVVAIATVVVGSVRRGLQRGTNSRRAAILYTTFFDLLLALPTVTSIGVVGLGVGGYGERMVRMILPHGIIELAGFALALAVYVDARRRPPKPCVAAAALGMSIVVLAIAAVTETYINP